MWQNQNDFTQPMVPICCQKVRIIKRVLEMAKSAGINRRTFIKNASLTAFAGATGGIATGSTVASAASSSKMANGKYDFDTVYDRVDHNTARWDSPPKSYPEGTFKSA